MKHLTLFSIGISHSYFAPSSSSSIDQYLQLLPSVETETIMSQLRLKLMYRPEKTLLVSSNRSNNSKLVNKEIKFRFYLRVTNNDFFYITDLSSNPYNPLKDVLSRLKIPYYENDGTNKDLKLSDYKFYVIDRFILEGKKERLNPSYFYLKNTPYPGLNKDNFEIFGLKVQNPPLIPDKYESQLQRLEVNTQSQDFENRQPFSIKYRSFPNWDSSILGLIDITIDGKNPTYNTSYSISFEAKKEKWKYLVVTKPSVTNLKVENGTLKFEDAKEISAGEDFDRIRSIYMNARLFSIVSKDETEYSALIKQKIKLKDGSKTLIENLPNPSAKDGGRAIINIYS